MNEVFLDYNGIRLLNLPHGKGAIYDEVLVQDCYRIDTIPKDSIVLDVGGFYGEFAVACAIKRHCLVHCFEPSALWRIAELHAELNGTEGVTIHSEAVGKEAGGRYFRFRPDAPYGSHLDASGLVVACTTLPTRISFTREHESDDAAIAVKLDCEGAEREIFEDESWLKEISWLAMEWHNQDSPRYREILTRHGFKLDTNEPNPEAWRGIIYATKL